MLVVDLVLERDCGLTESPARNVPKRTIYERGDAFVTGGDILRAAYGCALADLLCVLTPDVASYQP
jgi:hypothetical protein